MRPDCATAQEHTEGSGSRQQRRCSDACTRRQAEPCLKPGWRNGRLRYRHVRRHNPTLDSQTLLSFALPAPRCGALQPAATACNSDRRFLTQCVARTRGALQPAAPRTMQSRAAGAFDSTFAKKKSCACGLPLTTVLLPQSILIHSCSFLLTPSSSTASLLHPLPFQVFSVTPGLRFSAPKRDTLPPCLWASRGRRLHEVTMSPLPLGSIRGIAFCSSCGVLA